MTYHIAQAHIVRESYIYMVWDTIWKKGVFLLSYSMGVPYNINGSVDFLLHDWNHQIGQQ